MASSQVDIAASSNPFGCILRHHNRRDGCHESSVRTPQSNNNLKDLVRTRVRTRTPDNFKTTHDNIDSWIKNQDKETNNVCDVPDRWAAAPHNSAQEELSVETMSPPSISSSPSSSPQKPPSRGAAASSLVQIWEARLGRSTAPSMVSNSSGHCDSPPRYNENTSFNEETSPHSETLGDLETHRMNPNEPAPETIENPRVADIIRRFITVSSRNGNKNLSKVNETSESPPLKEQDSNRDYDCTIASGNNNSEQKSSRSLESNHTEQRVLVHYSTNDDSKGSDHLVEQRRLNISQCPRIRGRQALKELLSLMEMDRKKELDNLRERKPVSKFTHKGRIQSLLKLKIIQRGLALQNQWRPYTGSTALQPHHSSHGPTSANYSRENMTAATDKVIKAKPDTASSSICQVTSDSKPINSHCEIKQRIEEEQQIQNKENTIPESSVCDKTSQITWNARNQDAGSFPDSSCSAKIDVTVPANEVGADETRVASNAELDGGVHEEPSETIFRDANGGEDSVGVPESVESCYGWYQEWTQLEGDDHEDDDDDQNQDETLEDDGYEWFLGVSRPRSYWENLRQSWYRQVLETDSTNAEIRQLLERRTVSNFLTTSEFQDRMNNMMMTHIEEQNHRLNEDEDSDHSAMGSLKTMRRFLSSYLQQQTQSPQINSNRSIAGEEEEHEEEAQEIQEEEQTDDDDDDEETFMRRQERMEEVMSNCLQVSSSQDLDQEESDEEEDGDVIDENEYVREDQDDGSPNNWHHNDTQMTLWSCRYNQTNNDRLSMETEMINDLRAQIKELHQEMSELRRSISSCVNMQVKLQDSCIKKEIISTVRVDERNTSSDERAPRKGYCCICYDTKVDSLLYRCGHMCTCFKCAQELQMGSGKCPICRASILDVVRAYTDS